MVQLLDRLENSDIQSHLFTGYATNPSVDGKFFTRVPLCVCAKSLCVKATVLKIAIVTYWVADWSCVCGMPQTYLIDSGAPGR